MKKYILIIITAGFMMNAFTQSDCLKILEEAGKAFEQGMIEDIPEKLSGCMESGFTRAQKIEAYKLMIMAYLFDDSQYEAEKTMLDFLRKYPEYQIMPNDPVEFVYLFESYRVTSVLSLSLFAGPTFSNPSVKEPYSAFSASSNNSKNITGTGISIGLGVSRELFRNFKLNVDAIYVTNNYSFTDENITQVDDNSIPGVEITYEETIKRFSFPVTFTYDFRIKNLTSYIRAGASAELLSDATASVEKINNYTSSNLTANNVNVKDNRNQMTVSAVLGAGVRIKVPRGFLVVDARYNKGMMDFSVENPIAQQELTTTYFYRDDVFSLDYVTVNMGYIFSIYQSNKKRY